MYVNELMGVACLYC